MLPWPSLPFARPKPRTLAILAVLVLLLVAAALATRFIRPRCDESRLQAAVAALASTPYPERPAAAATAILTACPAPDSERLRSHLVFLNQLQASIPAMYRADREDPAFAALWREVCPHGPAGAELYTNRDTRHRYIHAVCELDRLGVLTPDEGRVVAPSTIRTWALHPWLTQLGVPPGTTRELLRAALLWPGWTTFKYLPQDLELPLVTPAPPQPLGYQEFLFVTPGSLRLPLYLEQTIDMTSVAWRVQLAEYLEQRGDGMEYALFAAPTISGETLLQVVALITQHSPHVALVVRTDAPYQPYAELPIALTHDPQNALPVRHDVTVGELVPQIVARLPCCGEVAPAECPRECQPVPLADGFRPR